MKYEKPRMEIVLLEHEDIVCVSDPDNDVNICELLGNCPAK